MKIRVNNLSETKMLAKSFAKTIKNGDVVLLNGDLGAGKTTFTRNVFECLGINSMVNSPTFAILKTYYGKFVCHHFDFYRINTDEAIEAGFDEILSNTNSVKFIEWGNNVEAILPPNNIVVNITFIDETIRDIEIVGQNK